VLFVSLDNVGAIGQIFDDFQFFQKILLGILVSNLDDFDSKQFFLIGPAGDLVDLGELTFSQGPQVHGVLVLIACLVILEGNNFYLLRLH